MFAQPQKQLLTPEEYLAMERAAEDKSDYVDGVMYAMAGGSPQHSLIASNVNIELGSLLRDRACFVFNSDMKVRVPSSRKFHYPDVSVVCGKPVFAYDEKDVLLNPLLIVEVLSRSTANFDHREKFLHYQEIESFQEYLLISQDAPVVQHFVKQADGTWRYQRITGLEQNVGLTTIDCTLELARIYAKVDAL